MKLSIKLILFLLILLVLPVSAQRNSNNRKSNIQSPSIQKFTLTTDHISQKDRRVDYNNVSCALVKVQATDDITKVEGGKIGDIVDYGGEKWVYMVKGSRRMKLHFANNIPIEITFNKYKIKSLESNRVYELVINTPNKSQQAVSSTVQTGTYVMKVYPADTEVTIVGDAYGPKTYRTNIQGELTLNLSYGRYYCTLKSDGYESKNEEILVVDKYTVSDFVLNEMKGYINIICKDKGSDFIIDGKFILKDREVKAHREPVSPGKHKVEIRRKGKLVYGKEVDVAVGEEEIVNTEEKKAKKSESKKQPKEKEKIEKKRIEKQQKKNEAKGKRNSIFSLTRPRKQGNNNIQVPEVRNNVQQQGNAHTARTRRNHVAYIKMATTSELQNASLIETSLFETTITVNENNKGHLSPIDIREFRVLPGISSSKTPKILPERYKESYELKETYKNVYELKIVDSELFWQDSDYLIIQLF